MLFSYFKDASSELLKLVRFFIKEARGNLWDISRDKLKKLLILLEKEREIPLPGKFKVFIRDGYLWASPGSFFWPMFLYGLFSSSTSW